MCSTHQCVWQQKSTLYCLLLMCACTCGRHVRLLSAAAGDDPNYWMALTQQADAEYVSKKVRKMLAEVNKPGSHPVSDWLSGQAGHRACAPQWLGRRHSSTDVTPGDPPRARACVDGIARNRTVWCVCAACRCACPHACRRLVVDGRSRPCLSAARRRSQWRGACRPP